MTVFMVISQGFLSGVLLLKNRYDIRGGSLHNTKALSKYH